MAYDLITVGRANMDLYSADVGEPFEKVRNFTAMVGGSPTNIAIATSRLGMRSVVFTGVGNDVVGDFVIDYLINEGVVIDHVNRIEGKRTSLALLGVEPPSHFPLLFYRDDPADIHLTAAHAATLPFGSTRAMQLSGNALSRGSTATVAWQLARDCSSLVDLSFVDLDLRPTDWAHPADFGNTMRRLVPLVDVVIGTEEEFAGVFLDADRSLGAKATRPEIALIDDAAALASATHGTSVVIKRGAGGASVFTPTARHDVAGYRVEVVNTVGAGDAFASGLIYGRLRGDDWEGSLSFANACGAIQVTRHGCSIAFPTADEVAEFLDRTPNATDG